METSRGSNRMGNDYSDLYPSISELMYLLVSLYDIFNSEFYSSLMCVAFDFLIIMITRIYVIVGIVSITSHY